MEIERADGKIKVKSGYNKDFIKKAKELNGKWNEPFWVFDEKVAAPLEKVLINIYGEGFTEVGRTTIEIDLDIYGHQQGVDGELKFKTMTLARRRFRDKPVIISSNAWVIKGEFKNRGGSMKYPEVSWEKGTVIRAEVPITFAEDLPEGVKVIEDIDSIKDKLLKEKENLLEKIEEIDKRLEAL